jgi:hypothetical protein
LAPSGGTDMKKLTVFAILLALLVPGAAFAGSSTDAALGLGAFAVFNQIISGAGVFGAFAPAPRPVVLPAPPPPVVVPQYYPVYVERPVYYAPAPVYYAPPPVYYAPAHYPRVYHAPARVVVKERGFVPPGHWKGHPGRGWR